MLTCVNVVCDTTIAQGDGRELCDAVHGGRGGHWQGPGGGRPPPCRQEGRPQARQPRQESISGMQRITGPLPLGTVS